MPTRPLVYADNPILRRKSHRVQQVTPALRALINDMIETMRAANGIGLAAIQIGVPQRVIVVELPAEAEDDDSGERAARPQPLYVLINPEIRRASAEMEEGVEGCLSVPGWAGEVPRHVAITVKGLDIKGKPLRLKAEGLLARVLQHEIDHCEGILFIDRIEDPEKIWQVTVGEEEAAEARQERPSAPPEATIE